MEGLDGLFMDELLNEPYADPVMAEDGFIYERSFISEWFAHGGTKSPKTLLPMGTALFYPFAYYQMRAVWRAAKHLPADPFPERYGRLTDVAVPSPSVCRPTRGSAAAYPGNIVTINYNSSDEEDRADSYEDEFPPLPRGTPPDRPPMVVLSRFNRRMRRAPSSRTGSPRDAEQE